jgi:hypothetical protein
MSSPASPPEDGSIELSRRETVRMVSRCVAERRPIAVVRFGEGEARLLAAKPADPASMLRAIKKLRRQTGLIFSAEEMLEVRALVLSALDQADVVGLRTSASFADEHRELGDLIASVYTERVAQGRRPAYLTHSLLNNDLRDALPALLSERRRVSVVSCRDIGPTLEADHGLADVTAYQVPSQYVVRDVDGPYEAALHDVPIWPDFYRRLETEIAVHDAGEVFLVGAGLFGKDLCIRIRDLGGIALDMGSTLDGVASKVTRGGGRPAFRPLPKMPRLVWA